MKKDESIDYVRKTICLKKKLCDKIDELSKNDDRKFSPWVALFLEKTIPTDSESTHA